MARTISADGRTVTVPDDATPEEVNQIFGPAPTDTPPAPLSGSISGAGSVPVPSGLQGSGSDATVTGLKQALLGPNPIGNTVANAGKHLFNDTVGTAKTMLQPPQNTGESVAQAAMPGGLQLYRAAIQPSLQPAKDAYQAVQQGRYGDAANSAMDAIPVVGPYARNFENEVGSQGLLPAMAGAAVDYGTGKAIGGVITKAVTPGTMTPGENFTNGQHASMSGVLARGSTSDKGFFPKQVTTDIGSSVRQAAADNPAIHDTIMHGAPEESLAGTQALLQKVRQGIDEQHNQALTPVQNTPINPQQVQSAVRFPSSLKDFAPEDAAAIADLRTRLGSIKTLGGLNDLRQYLNTELSNQFKMNKVAAGNSGAVTSAMQDALKAARNMYYDELQKATGTDFSGLKRQEGSVLSAEEALQNAAPKLAAKQAIAEQPMSTKATIGEALQGAHTVSGSPVAGTARLIARKVFGQTPMTPVQEGLQSFFEGADRLQPTPARPTAQYVQPGQTTALVPAGPRPAQQKPPAQLAAANGPAPAYVPRAQVGGRPNLQLAAPPTPGRVIPLPAQASQQLLGSGTGGPDFVNPSASYPPLNESTAVTNVNAGTPRPAQEEIPQRTIQVNPQGQAAIQRPALPPPATHAFSQKGWQSAHPNGNLKTAIKQAQAKGYRIVE